MKIAALVAIGALAISAPAYASYTINVAQVGADVVATGSGSIDFSALTFQGFDFDPANVDASGADMFLVGSAGYGDIYAGASGPTQFGSGGHVAASSSTGGNLASIGVDGPNQIIIPGGYFPGETMDPVTTTWSGQTISSLGLTPGAYTWTWGSDANGNADSLTLNIAGGVPEPAAWALMLLGMGGLGAVLRARRDNRSAAITA